MESLQGQLLVAAPTLVDPNFHRAVVLVTEDSDTGAVGLVLNRPSEASVGEAVPELVELVDPASPVYAGGPVEPAAVLVVAEFEDVDESAAAVFDGIGFVRSGADMSEVDAVRARVYAGYCGWGAEQLEAELEAEAWFVADAEPDDVFADDAEGLWSAVLRRQGGHFALVATMPPDPSLN